MIEEIEYIKPKLHLFICCNERGKDSPLKISCSPTITAENVAEVKKWIVEHGLHREILITKTGCLGKCTSKGGVILSYPENKYYLGIQNTKEIIEIIQKKLN